VIDDNSGSNIAKAAGENWRRIETPGRKVIEAQAKNKFYVISPKETAKMKAAAEPVFDRWYGEMKKIGIDGPALVSDARALIGKYSK
jgi:hypothetical protein